jgi:2-aminobenzoate-CoA ligase
VVGFDGTANHDAELDRVALRKPVRFRRREDGPRRCGAAGLHQRHHGRAEGHDAFPPRPADHRRRLCREVLGVTPDDVFVGSPPLAFTFGLGGLAVFPLRFGAAAALLEQASLAEHDRDHPEHRATVCFTAPTAYRVMLKAMDEGADLSSLRAAVSAGETLPAPVYEDWMAKTGKPMLDGIGATEMLHIFITNRFDDHRPACTGRPVTGYEARDRRRGHGRLPRGEVGRLAVRGPTGCRYWPTSGSATMSVNGWNLTGDSFWQDDEGRFHFAARSDDMIISRRLQHRGARGRGGAAVASGAVAECAVIGAPDEARGQIVEAHVVLAAGQRATR